MRTVTVFLCLLGTVYGGPVHRQSLHHIFQQAQQHQQRAQPEGISNLEALQELARVRQILEQYAKVFPPINSPAVQPQNAPMLVLPSGTPIETPPQVSPTVKNPKVQPLRLDQQGEQVVPEVVSTHPSPVAELPVQPMTQTPQPETSVAQAAPPNEQQPQAGPPVIMPVQPNTWAMQPGIPFLVPLPPNTQETQPADQPAVPVQIPPIFPSYGLLPVFPSQTGTPQFPGYGMPLFVPTGYPQQPMQPAEPDQAVQTGQAVQPVQPVQPQTAVPTQQQIPQIVYMIRQPMVGPFGSASSEEIQATGVMGGISMIIPGFGTSIAAPGVGTVIPGVLPAGQGADPGVREEPALPNAPTTSGGPLISTGLEVPLSKDPAAGLTTGKSTDHSNLPHPSLAKRFKPSGTIPPMVSTASSNPNATPVPERDLYP